MNSMGVGSFAEAWRRAVGRVSAFNAQLGSGIGRRRKEGDGRSGNEDEAEKGRGSRGRKERKR